MVLFWSSQMYIIDRVAELIELCLVIYGKVDRNLQNNLFWGKNPRRMMEIVT